MNSLDKEFKLNNRFNVIFPLESGLESWMVKSIERPSFNFNKKEWSSINIIFICPISPCVEELVQKYVMSLKKEYLTGDVEKIGELSELKIEILDPVGEVIEVDVIILGNIESIKFSDLNHSESALMTCELECNIKSYINGRK